MHQPGCMPCSLSDSLGKACLLQCISGIPHQLGHWKSTMRFKHWQTGKGHRCNCSSLDLHKTINTYTCCLEDDVPQELDSIVGPECAVILQEGRSAACLPKQSLYYGQWRSCYSGAESIQNSCYSAIQDRTTIAYVRYLSTSSKKNVNTMDGCTRCKVLHFESLGNKCTQFTCLSVQHRQCTAHNLPASHITSYCWSSASYHMWHAQRIENACQQKWRQI